MLQFEHAVCTFNLRLQNATWPRKFDYTNRSSVSQVIVSIVVVSLKRFGWMIKEINWLRYKFTWLQYWLRVWAAIRRTSLNVKVQKWEGSLCRAQKQLWHRGICAIFGYRQKKLLAHDVKWKIPLRSVCFVAGNRYSFQLCSFVCCTGILRWHCDCYNW